VTGYGVAATGEQKTPQLVAGGGETSAAALQLRARFLGLHIDPEYYSISEDRLSEATECIDESEK